MSPATIVELGRRVELVSMDAHFHDISLALYRQERGGGPVGLVHTYSPKPGAAERTASVARAMAVLGGLEPVDGDEALVRFPCRSWHEAAAKRIFLEACKADPAAPVAARPLEIVDRRTGQQIRVEPLGGGSYRVHADGANDETPSRAPAVAGGLAKLAELVPGDDREVVTFPCGRDHDALVGLLLGRALNVRASLREEEERSARGVLAAPSQQQVQQDG
jgi:hypothetical protein